MKKEPKPRDPDTIDIEIKLLLQGVFLKYGSDFRNYTLASVRRRILLALERLGFQTISQLQDRVLSNPETYERLLQFLTVPTSEMFRDPSYYRTLQKTVFPVLQTYPSIKIWIAGCSTGEELYSFAILLKESGLLSRSILYATDVNPQSLRKAETGSFALDQIRLFTENYQKCSGMRPFSDYYVIQGDRAIFNAELREHVAFADHSLATDSVFAELQLISCRNVLIYFNRELQNRAFELFRESLGHRGFLGLGSKETIRLSAVSTQFDEVDPQERIYRKKVLLR